MNNCIRCSGSGYEVFWDDGWERDICYHCSGSGRVDDETMWYDKLSKVAASLAYNRANLERSYRNTDPDGEDWDFIAAENMLSGSDYFKIIVEDYTAQNMEKLLEMDREKQEVLVAWNDIPVTAKKRMDTGVQMHTPYISSSYGDDLPF